MVTGRKLIETALRAPMRERGWTPRASGWFTRATGPGALWVVAVGVASKCAAPGTAMATAHVHFRDAELEAQVAGLCGWQDQGYRTTTGTTSIGYLMPDACWHEWHVEPDTADAVAHDVAQAVQTYAEPYLRELAEDPRCLLASIVASPSYLIAHGLARAVVLLGREGQLGEASEFLGQRLAALASRTDAAAAEERRVADLLHGWLAR